GLLKGKFQRQLTPPSRHRLRENSSRVPGRVGRRSGIEEIGVVQDIEVLGAQLEPALFIQLELLEERKIQIVQPGTGNNIAAGVSVLLRRRLGKERWIEAFIDA